MPRSIRLAVRSMAIAAALSCLVPSVGRGAVESISAADISSEFQGELALAKAALDRGDDAGTRRLLENIPDGSSRRFLQARLLAAEGKAVEAAQAYAALASDYPLLADYWAAQASGFYESAERWDDALAAMDKVSPSSSYASSLALPRARVLEKKGDAKAALEAYSKVGGVEGIQGRLRVVESGEVKATGTAAQEKGRTLVKLWREYPLAKLTEEQEKYLFPDRLRSSDGAGAKPAFKGVTLEDSVARGEKLLSLHHNRKAIQLLSSLLQPPRMSELKDESWKATDLECRVRFAIGEGYRKERKHEDAIRVLTPVVERCLKQKEKALYSLASSQSIAHPERGPGFYDRYIREFPTSKKLDQAEWFAADLEIKNGAMEAVAVRLDRLVKNHPKSRYAPEALFKRFWLQWTAKDADEVRRLQADAWLEKLVKGWPGNLEERIRAEYWLGRIKKDAGNSAGAIEVWKKLATSAPQRFYGVLALRGIEEVDATAACEVRQAIAGKVLGSAPSESDVGTNNGDASSMDAARRDVLSLLPRKIGGGLAADKRLEMALQFMRLDLMDEARAVLNQMAKGKQGRDDRMTIAILQGLSGDLRGAQVTARVHFASVFEKPISAGDRGLWMLAWPRAHRSLIEKHCPTKGVNPDQLQSLMREESALDANARSWAGALGLTQMMPSRAKDVAAMLSWKEFHEEDLFRPEVAIELGCTWLGKLLADFSGDEMHAFAAYNADTGRVRSWDKAVPDGSADRFVEQIPIAETRNYVKRLVRSEATYLWLYSAETMSACGKGTR